MINQLIFSPRNENHTATQFRARQNNFCPVIVRPLLRVMNNPIVIGASVGVLVGIVVALVTRWRAGHWRCGTAVVVAIITGVVTGVPAIWYGWIASVYGVVAGYIFGFITIREAIHDRDSTHDNAA